MVHIKIAIQRRFVTKTVHTSTQMLALMIRQFGPPQNHLLPCVVLLILSFSARADIACEDYTVNTLKEAVAKLLKDIGDKPTEVEVQRLHGFLLCTNEAGFVDLSESIVRKILKSRSLSPIALFQYQVELAEVSKSPEEYDKAIALGEAIVNMDQFSQRAALKLLIALYQRIDQLSRQGKHERVFELLATFERFQQSRAREHLIKVQPALTAAGFSEYYLKYVAMKSRYATHESEKADTILFELLPRCSTELKIPQAALAKECGLIVSDDKFNRRFAEFVLKIKSKANIKYDKGWLYLDYQVALSLFNDK